MEEKTKAENMNLDNIITDIISAEEQEDSSARVLQVPAVALRGMTVLPGLVIHFDFKPCKIHIGSGTGYDERSADFPCGTEGHRK